MKNLLNSFNLIKSIALLMSFFFAASATSQTIYDANGKSMAFLASRKVHKVGTNGSAAGNVTLYTNVITIGGQSIDCIVRTVSLNNCSFTLPSGAATGTIPFDYSATSAGSTLTGNKDSFFSPTMNFSASGYVEFKFEFIQGGTYNNGTNTGTSVILQNVYVNSYDIDGSSRTYQFSEFGGFIQSTLGTGNNIDQSYNTNTSLTTFQSNVATNQTNITGDAHRIRVKYEFLSSFTITLGQTGSGAAYYFLDFGMGVNWSQTPITTTVVSLDLSTDSSGFNYNNNYCSGNQKLTQGGSNISNSTNAITELGFTYDSSSILNGNLESFIIKKSTGNDTIKLKFTSNGTQTFAFNAVNYSVSKSFLPGGFSKIAITKNGGGTLTSAQIEALMDSMYYNNKSNTTGLRSFSVYVQESVYTSNTAVFNVNIDCSALPVELIRLNAKIIDNHSVLVSWSTATEIDNSHFDIEKYNANTNTWEIIGVQEGHGNSNQVIHYEFKDQDASENKAIYRLIQHDYNGKATVLGPISVNRTNNASFHVSPNPFNDQLEIFGNIGQFTKIEIIDQLGKVIFEMETEEDNNHYTIDLSTYQKGIYYFRGYADQQVVTKKLQKI